MADLGRLGEVRPVEGVPGGIPIPVVITVVGNLVTATAQQNLALGSLSLTTSVGAAWMPRFVTLALSAALVAAQVLTITMKSALGAAYDVPVELVTLGIGATSYVFSFPPNFPFEEDDEVQVTLTNTGASETAVASVTVRGEE